MNNITIKSASLKDNQYLNVGYSEQQPDGFSDIKKQCKIPVHPDLKDAFKSLDAHLAALTFQHDKKGKVDFPSISCNSFSITDNGGVVLSGTRTLTSDKDLNLSSPSQKLDGDFYDYKDTEDLMLSIEVCKTEILAYLFEGKHEEDNQLALFPELEEAQA
jgi:hypothetical protein